MATTETRTHQNYIAGEWVDAASGETFDSTSPADGELIGTFPRSGADDVDRAVAAAKEAFAEWRLVPAPKRGEVLFRFAQLVTDNKVELTDLVWDTLYAPVAAGVAAAADRLNHLQFLTIRQFLSLVFAALVILLLVLAIWP